MHCLYRKKKKIIAYHVLDITFSQDYGIFVLSRMHPRFLKVQMKLGLLSLTLLLLGLFSFTLIFSQTKSIILSPLLL